MPKLEFDIIDYMAPVVVALVFAIILFIISFAVINWYCITHKDDLTVFEKFGAGINMRLGPHTLLQVKRGGYASTYAKEEDEEIRRKSTQLLKGLELMECKLIKSSELGDSQVNEKN